MSREAESKALRLAIAGLRTKPLHLEKLRFPNYRNLRPGEELVFRFPITVLLGRNGTNKSSVLQAIYGAERGKSIGDYWFETALDAIPESNSDGLKQSVAHTYHDSHGALAECLKARAPRGLGDPDYWEAAKPSKVYGFPPGAPRVPPHSIPTTYLDFRQVLPVFDKYFYFPDERHLERLQAYAKSHATLRRTYRRQDYLRRRAPVVKQQLLANGRAFSARTLAAASEVLGRTYTSGRYLEHALYRGHRGTTMVVQTKHFSGGYSDAFAGSGESAALTLINAVENAKDALILLDEPETSLHPMAQQRMLEFLCQRALRQNLQFVIATHSAYFGEGLPIEAVRLLREEPDGRVRILEGLSVSEALHDLADLPRERTILVEDVRAQAIMLAALQADGGILEKTYEVTVRRGGVSKILADIWAHGAAGTRNVLIVLDGDQRPQQPLPPRSSWPRGVAPLEALIKEQIRGGNRNGPALALVDEEDGLAYLHFLQAKVRYLPGTTPESIVWVKAHVKALGAYHGLADSVLNEIETHPDFKDRIRLLSERIPGMSHEGVFESLLAHFLRSDSDDALMVKRDLVAWVRDET